jgi:hypothetical protein
MDDFNPWTEQGAQGLLEAAEALAQAIRIHARTLVELIDTRDDDLVFNANDALLPEVIAYADAQGPSPALSFPLAR